MESQQHPIPQQIASYQFRLVGDMTLKQFFQVGGGALVSLLIYATGLHPFIKWPLILFSFGLGAALAFMPLEERPLSTWIFSFFKSIYSPTVFIWEKREKHPVYFQEEAPIPKDTGIATPHGEMVMEEYLQKRPEEKEDVLSKFENQEITFLSRVTNLLKGVTTITQPKPKVPTEEKKEEEKKEEDKKLEVPDNAPVSIASKGFRPKVVVEEKPLQETVSQKPKETTSDVAPTLTEEAIKAQQAQFSPEAAPPNPPTIPNTVVGQVMDMDGKIIEGAILEIRDMAGRPVRALRSNKLGHFMIVTSLSNGQYDIITEKEGYEFDPITFEAKGDIIPPIAIRAKRKVEEKEEK